MTYHLLLVLCVLGDEQSNTLTDTTLLEELFELFLYGYIQRVELEMQKKKDMRSRMKTQRKVANLRSEIQPTSFPISIASQSRTGSGVLVVGDVVNDEVGFLADHVEIQRASALGLRWETSEVSMSMTNMSVGDVGVGFYLCDSKRDTNRISV